MFSSYVSTCLYSFPIFSSLISPYSKVTTSMSSALLFPPHLQDFRMLECLRAKFWDLFSSLSAIPYGSAHSLTSINTTSILITSNFVSPVQTLLWALNSCVRLPIWHHHLDGSLISQLYTPKTQIWPARLWVPHNFIFKFLKINLNSNWNF